MAIMYRLQIGAAKGYTYALYFFEYSDVDNSRRELLVPQYYLIIKRNEDNTIPLPSDRQGYLNFQLTFKYSPSESDKKHKE